MTVMIRGAPVSIASTATCACNIRTALEQETSLVKSQITQNE